MQMHVFYQTSLNSNTEYVAATVNDYSRHSMVCYLATDVDY